MRRQCAFQLDVELTLGVAIMQVRLTKSMHRFLGTSHDAIYEVVRSATILSPEVQRHHFTRCSAMEGLIVPLGWVIFVPVLRSRGLVTCLNEIGEMDKKSDLFMLFLNLMLLSFIKFICIDKNTFVDNGI